MSKWYYRDGTLAADMSSPNWEEGIRKVDKLLRDPKYKRVAEDTLEDGKWISTVWLGLDYSYPFSYKAVKPLIFETMVFSSKKKLDDLDMDRYSTEEEAFKGHKKMVAKWKRKIKK